MTTPTTPTYEVVPAPNVASDVALVVFTSITTAMFSAHSTSIMHIFLSTHAESINSDLQRGLAGQTFTTQNNIEHRTEPVSH